MHSNEAELAGAEWSPRISRQKYTISNPSKLNKMSQKSTKIVFFQSPGLVWVFKKRFFNKKPSGLGFLKKTGSFEPWLNPNWSVYNIH